MDSDLRIGPKEPSGHFVEPSLNVSLNPLAVDLTRQQEDPSLSEDEEPESQGPIGIFGQQDNPSPMAQFAGPEDVSPGAAGPRFTELEYREDVQSRGFLKYDIREAIKPQTLICNECSNSGLSEVKKQLSTTQFIMAIIL
mmetsp:Transcript_8035/g.9165  ORF Transcript_8035/g.9165 Transcript_8035/m.9165 type:complete len:140 (-) Transcript_8035:181-600(-)